jgi:hypothetical protein
VTKRLATKRSATKRLGEKHPEAQNVQGKKHPVGQDIQGDKTSGGTKRPVTEQLSGQNVHGEKENVRQGKKSPLISGRKFVLTSGNNIRGRKTPGKEKSPRFPNSHNLIVLPLHAILFYNNYIL